MQLVNTVFVASVVLSGFAVAAPIDAATNEAATFPLLLAGLKLNGTAINGTRLGRPRLPRPLLARPRPAINITAAREALAAGLASGSLPVPPPLAAWIDAGIPLPAFLAPYVNAEAKTINITAIEGAIASGAIPLPAPIALAIGAPVRPFGGRPRLPSLFDDVLEAWGIDTDSDDAAAAMPRLMPLRPPFGGLRPFGGRGPLGRFGRGSLLSKLWMWKQKNGAAWAAMMAAAPAAAAAAAGTAADAAVAAAPAAAAPAAAAPAVAAPAPEAAAPATVVAAA